MIVRTEKEFEKALENKEPKIIYEGPEAEKIVAKIQAAQKKRSRTKKWGIGLGILCIAAAPFTGGGSLLGLGATAGAIALSEGVIIAIIGAVVSISVAAINAIKEYKLEQERNRLILTRK